MRRLIGLIALLVLILGAAWLVRNDFDLNRIAEFDTLFEPAGEGAVTEAPPEDVASAPASETTAAPATSQTEGEEEVPSEATAAAEAESALETSGASEADGAMAPDASSVDSETDTAMAESNDGAETELAVVVPSFDIVRVEPTGETVIAGVAEPQAMVEVLNGVEAVATAEANERGEWALVLEVPLPPGTHDLGIRTTTQDRSLVTLSDQRVAVSVPESADEEALVVLNAPDAPSRVMQLPAETETAAAPEAAAVPEPQTEAMPEGPPSGEETEVAAVPTIEPTTEMPPSSGADEMASAEPQAEPPAAPVDSPAGGTGVASAPQTAEPVTEAPSSDQGEVASVSAESEPSAEMPSSGADEMASAEPQAEPPAAPIDSAAGETEVASAPEPQPVPDPSDAPEAPADPSAMVSATETTLEAAAAPAESPPMAETEVAASPDAAPAPSDGTEAGESPVTAAAEAGSETIAAAAPDAPEPMTAAAPAESPEPPAAGAEISDETPPSSEPSPATEKAAMPPASNEMPSTTKTATAEPAEAPSSAGPEAEPPVVVEAPPRVTPEVGVSAVEAETNGALYIAGTATTPEPVRVYVDEEFVGEATPTESGTWLLETTREMAPDEYTIRADQIEAGSGSVVARAEVPFEREIDVATLKPVGESVSAGTAEVSGSVAGPMTVIIKRGDNLWRISREMYGRGIRYSTIYQANRDQIRNPNLIYPGQVFVLPAGDTAWESQR